MNSKTVFFLLLVPFISAVGQEGNFRDEVSYSNDIQPIVKNFCTTCHAGDDPEGDFVLTSYADVRKHTEKGKLLKRINDAKDPMPEDGLMPEHFRRLFKLWAQGGYINKGKKTASRVAQKYEKFTPPEIRPVDISKGPGFELLEKLQGHWVGSMNLMGTNYDWMAFDYRAIAPSHVHGIFEGGTIGNLFNSFFVTQFRGRQTIMVRNGGLLNGIYRTSYFVLDRIQKQGGNTAYRLVDAYGGNDIMFMELTFSGDSLTWYAYTSRLGLKEPSLHMAFKAKRKRPEIARAAAKAVGFPKQKVDFLLPDPLPKPTWVGEYPQTSATYLSEEPNKSLVELGKLSKDPRRADQMPYLSSLKIDIQRSKGTEGKKLLIYLSQKALTTAKGKFILQGGYIRLDLLDTLLSFPELSTKTSDFTFTYLHPGEYFLTVIADMDGDGYPSPGDITHPRIQLKLKPESKQHIQVKNLAIQN